MKTEALNTTWNELVFSNRNKHYGAYLLRKVYHDHLTFAFGVSTLIFLLWIGAARLTNTEIVVPVERPIIGEHTLIPDPIIERIIRTRVVPPQPPVVNQDQAIRVTTQEVTEVVSPTTPPEPTAPTNSGTEGTGVTATTAGIGTIVEGPLAPVESKIHDNAEVMPKYEGGVQGMMKFLGKKLKYPRAAVALKTEGTVFVSFVIDMYGDVVDVKVVRGVSPECDAEAVRVVKLMKDWTAGRQHDMPVSVRMMLPIKFQIPN